MRNVDIMYFKYIILFLVSYIKIGSDYQYIYDKYILL